MPRKAGELSPLKVRRLDKPGRWSVGGADGLALQVTENGARQRVQARYWAPCGGSSTWRRPFGLCHVCV
jgi:hypothetical protein